MGLRLDYAAQRLVNTSGDAAHLFPQERSILVQLVRVRQEMPGRPCSMDRLGQALWGPAACWPEDWRNVTLNRICGVRARLRKMRAPRNAIETLLHAGYVLTIDIEVVNEGPPAGGGT